jgi:hypothetical protein
VKEAGSGTNNSLKAGFILYHPKFKLPAIKYNKAMNIKN